MAMSFLSCVLGKQMKKFKARYILGVGYPLVGWTIARLIKPDKSNIKLKTINFGWPLEGIKYRLVLERVKGKKVWKKK